MEAAKLVGIPLTDLWPSFEGRQKTVTGHVVRTSVKDGTFRIQPQLKSLDQLGIAVNDGRIDPDHLRDFRNRLIQRVRRAEATLKAGELERRVDRLIAAIQADPSKVHEDQVLGEKWGPMKVERYVTVDRHSTPSVTEWAIAKIFFVFSELLLPEPFRLYYAPVTDYLREFLLAQAHDPVKKTGKGIFIHENKPGNASPSTL